MGGEMGEGGEGGGIGRGEEWAGDGVGWGGGDRELWKMGWRGMGWDVEGEMWDGLGWNEEGVGRDQPCPAHRTGGQAASPGAAGPSVPRTVPRAVNVLPNRVLGSVGQHLGEPIEQLAVAADGKLLASSGHDQKVKFWDVSALGSMVVDDYRRKKKKGGPLRALSSKALGSGEDFFADLRDETEPEAAAAEGGDSDSD